MIHESSVLTQTLMPFLQVLEMFQCVKHLLRQKRGSIGVVRNAWNVLIASVNDSIT